MKIRKISLRPKTILLNSSPVIPSLLKTGGFQITYCESKFGTIFFYTTYDF